MFYTWYQYHEKVVRNDVVAATKWTNKWVMPLPGKGSKKCHTHIRTQCWYAYMCTVLLVQSTCAIASYMYDSHCHLVLFCICIVRLVNNISQHSDSVSDSHQCHYDSSIDSGICLSTTICVNCYTCITRSVIQKHHNEQQQ